MRKKYQDSVMSAIEAANKSAEALKRAEFAADAAEDIEISTAALIRQSLPPEAALALEYVMQAAEFTKKSTEVAGNQQAITAVNTMIASLQSAVKMFKRKTAQSSPTPVLERALQAAEDAEKSVVATGNQQAIDDIQATVSSIRSVLGIYKLMYK
jgi:hypothetical protein